MPYSIEDFKREGLYEPKPASHADVGDLSGGTVVPVNGKLRKRLERTSNKSEQDLSVIMSLLESGLTPADAAVTFAHHPCGKAAGERHKNFADYLARTVNAASSTIKSNDGIEELDGVEWREEFKSRNQLSNEKPEYLLELLVPARSLTIISAPSFNAKTWLALQMAKAISTGTDLCGYFKTSRTAPIRYHVPEMNEAFVRERMGILGIKDSEQFLVRAMETGAPLPLNDPRMFASSRGAVSFLDTVGYFNEADDTNSYQQSLRFARSIFDLLRAGALGIVALYHPPKTTAGAYKMTLENMLLGSAGYGGVLRSCLGLRNLNHNQNDRNVLLYVEGLKNPGLSPFLLQGIPLTMKDAPGDCPYLSSLMAEQKLKISNPKQIQAFEIFEANSASSCRKPMSRDEMCEKLKISSKTQTKWKKEWEELKKEMGETADNEIVIYGM